MVKKTKPKPKPATTSTPDDFQWWIQRRYNLRNLSDYKGLTLQEAWEHPKKPFDRTCMALELETDGAITLAEYVRFVNTAMGTLTERDSIPWRMIGFAKVLRGGRVAVKRRK